MGLTENQMSLIKSVSQNDMTTAREMAVKCLEADTTAKNSRFCSHYKDLLQARQMLEVPANLTGILSMEDVSSSFLEGRYYLTERESKLYENIYRMKTVSEKLAGMRIPYLNSILLYGGSGTGKTTFGKYVAYKMGLPFCYINFSNLIDAYMGNTAKNISKVFRYISTNQCVFMLDEIDCISIRRSSAGSTGTDGEMARTTICLMQEFDNLANDIVIIGATNRKDMMDEALLRRFTVKHEVKVLSDADKIAMVKKYLNDIGIDISFTNNEIREVLKIGNQSKILNYLIHKIAKKIEEESDGL